MRKGYSARVFDRAKIGQGLAEKNFYRLDLSAFQLHFAKRMICQTIYELTGLDFGPCFLIVTNLNRASGHSSKFPLSAAKHALAPASKL